jgi:septation ring formation regulator EzrA
MALFSGRTSMLEVQNRALLKSAGERTQLISELERKLEQAGQALERLHAEREFYYKRVLALQQDNRELTEVAKKYSLWGQKLERELAKIDPGGVPARRFGAGHDA